MLEHASEAEDWAPSCRGPTSPPLEVSDGAKGKDMTVNLLMTALCLALIIKILNQL
jgi:hypothetical protein